MSWEEIGREWDGKVAGEAIGEAIAIAQLVVKLNVDAGQELAAPISRPPAVRQNSLLPELEKNQGS